MKFYTQYDRPGIDVCPLEKHEDEGKVERDGYMTIEQQVEEFMRAGEMLEAFRNAEYPADTDIPDDAPASIPLNRLDAMYEMGLLEKRVVNDLNSKKKVEIVPVVKESEVKKDEHT